MFRAIAALAMASTTANSPATLTSAAPWWERVTVTITDDGQTHSCRYESSLRPQNGQDCAVVDNEAASAKSSSAKDQYTRITFERRFSPGASPQAQSVQVGETLLGGRVMALAIDAKGAVKDCKVVATSGSVAPQYGCGDASAERFDASKGAEHTGAASRAGYMTVLVYGHSEHVV